MTEVITAIFLVLEGLQVVARRVGTFDRSSTDSAELTARMGDLTGDLLGEILFHANQVDLKDGMVP